MSPDVIIIGAGIMGLSTAFQISRRSTLNVLVLEKGRALGEGSTGASSAVCRHRYTRTEMIELARDGINAYSHWSEFTGLKSPLASFHNVGVLWLNNNGRSWAESEQARMHELDIAAEVISDEEIHERFPDLSTCTITPDLIEGSSHDCQSEGHFLFESSGGYFEPVDALTDLAAAAEAGGVEIRYNQTVEALVTDGGRATGVTMIGGETISAGLVVNTSGPWCNDILQPLGLADRWPLKPTRIQIMHLNRPAELTGRIPVCCDLVGGVYFREGNRGQEIVLGSALEEDEREVVDPSNYNNWVDDDFKSAKLHALKHRLPALPDNLQIFGYTGLYTVNQSDVHPVVGPSGIDNFYIANGFSGHGFKIGPAIGSLLAQQITGERLDFDTAISPDFLAFDRQPIAVDVMNVMA